jgi:hypothetical protein
MSKLTASKIIEALQNDNISVEEFAHMDYTPNSEIGKVEEVDSYGGEDMGSEWYSVQYFEKHGVYLKVEGYYQSYSGTDFEDWNSSVSEVKPVEKVVTVYE